MSSLDVCRVWQQLDRKHGSTVVHIGAELAEVFPFERATVSTEPVTAAPCE